MAKITIDIDFDPSAEDPAATVASVFTLTGDAPTEDLTMYALIAIEQRIAGEIREAYAMSHPMLNQQIGDSLVAHAARLTLLHEAMHTPVLASDTVVIDR